MCDGFVSNWIKPLAAPQPEAKKVNKQVKRGFPDKVKKGKKKKKRELTKAPKKGGKK